MARPQTLYRAPKGATLLEAPRLTAAEAAAGTPALHREAGRMLDCTATMAAEPTIRKEWAEADCTAAEVGRTYAEKEVTIACTLRSAADVKNIVLAWQGGSNEEVGGTAVTDEPTRDDIEAGYAHMLNLPSDGTATITDSEGTPNPAPEGTVWEWLNGSAQIIRILDVTGMTLPLLVSYNTAPSTEVGIMNQMGSGHDIVIQATNAEGGCTQEAIRFYNATLEGSYEDVLGLPPDSTDESPMTINFTASAHIDMPLDPILGNIGKTIR